MPGVVEYIRENQDPNKIKRLLDQIKAHIADNPHIDWEDDVLDNLVITSTDEKLTITLPTPLPTGRDYTALEAAQHITWRLMPLLPKLNNRANTKFFVDMLQGEREFDFMDLEGYDDLFAYSDPKPCGIDVYPEYHPRGAEPTSVTEGDMHGNAQKMLWCLLDTGVITLDKKDFEDFVRLYNQIPQTDDSLKAIDGFIAKIKLREPHKVLRLIGDVFSDRGKNDLITLKLCSHMKKAGLKLSITASNHDLMFLDLWNNKKARAAIINLLRVKDAEELLSDGPKSTARELASIDPSLSNDELNQLTLPLCNGQGRSFIHLMQSVASELVTEEDVNTLVNEAMLPDFKLFDYEITCIAGKPTLNLFTHAPVGLETLEAMVNQLRGLGYHELTYDDSTTHALCHTIDSLNSAFHHYMQAHPQDWQKLFHNHADDGSHEVSIRCPFARLIWNRTTSKPNTPVRLPRTLNDGMRLHLTHGHDGSRRPPLTNMTNIDNPVGKLARGSCAMGIADATPEEERAGCFHLPTDSLNHVMYGSAITVDTDAQLAWITLQSTLTDLCKQTQTIFYKYIKAVNKPDQLNNRETYWKLQALVEFAQTLSTQMQTGRIGFEPAAILQAHHDIQSVLNEFLTDESSYTKTLGKVLRSDSDHLRTQLCNIKETSQAVLAHAARTGSTARHSNDRLVAFKQELKLAKKRSGSKASQVTYLVEHLHKTDFTAERSEKSKVKSLLFAKSEVLKLNDKGKQSLRERAQSLYSTKTTYQSFMEGWEATVKRTEPPGSREEKRMAW